MYGCMRASQVFQRSNRDFNERTTYPIIVIILVISLKAAVFFAPGRRKQIAGLAAKGSKNNPDFVFSILYKNFFVRVVCFKNNFFK